MRHIVKRHGKTEPFDEKKLYASVYASSLNAHLDEEEAEKIAEKVTNEIKKIMVDYPEVTSSLIRKKVKKILDSIDEDVALLYDTYMDLC